MVFYGSRKGACVRECGLVPGSMRRSAVQRRTRHPLAVAGSARAGLDARPDQRRGSQPAAIRSPLRLEAPDGQRRASRRMRRGHVGRQPRGSQATLIGNQVGQQAHRPTARSASRPRSASRQRRPAGLASAERDRGPRGRSRRPQPRRRRQRSLTAAATRRRPGPGRRQRIMTAAAAPGCGTTQVPQVDGRRGRIGAGAGYVGVGGATYRRAGGGRRLAEVRGAGPAR